MPSYFDLLITRQVQLERLKSGASVVYLRELKKFESLLRLRFSELDEDAQELSRTKLEALISQVQRDQAAVIAAANKTQAKTDADTAQLYQVQEKLDLRATTNVPLSGLKTLRKGELIENILKTPLSVNGQLLEPMIKNYTATELRRVSGAIRKGATEGQTNSQIVRSIIGTKKNNYRDGVLETTRRNAAAVVNTSMQNAASGARHQFYEKNSETIKRYEWVSTLDSRTSSQCRSLDGRIFEVGKGPTPPIHINCRSTTAPVIEEPWGFLTDGQTRASATGQVDGDQTYYDWIKKQPIETQDKVLGPTRSKLLRDGGLSSEKFSELQLNKSFEPMTLEEMKKQEPEAFKEAGI